MKTSNVMAILIDKRTNSAPKVQEILTTYGSIIETRLGIHETDDSQEEGLILLVLRDDKEEISNLADELKEVTGVKVNTMELKFHE
ncbi:hypothetical protein [Acetohalobium arabaticum]|uniref:Iron-only hydrogenase system regulator n=1 Tax=Acetohalobium arabaticum (strain ATCC 49924 / DSM 5501 / Z-7288) TaxID=574087 RepID=D9QQ76_ACEAZ|nr:hypothetical protein [Acetohalobium arabaticum]ADL12667.1 conserved hypothetical protein [Acetohalobium arabaticum DSM 5501]